MLLMKGRPTKASRATKWIKCGVIYTEVNQLKNSIMLSSVYNTNSWQYLGAGFMMIDKLSAQKLPNATVEVPGTNGKYIITLEIFHQLHCLVSDCEQS